MTTRKQYLTRVQRIDLLLAENIRLLTENTELRQRLANTPNIPDCALCGSAHWPHCQPVTYAPAREGLARTTGPAAAAGLVWLNDNAPQSSVLNSY